MRRYCRWYNTGFLLCAGPMCHNMPLLTTDADFQRYTKFIPASLRTS